MQVKLSTSLLDIVVPDTYGSEFCNNVRDDMWDDFKNLMIQYAEQYISDALKETLFSDAKLSNFSFHSPQFYNYGTDWINFTMEFDDRLVDKIREKADDDFYNHIKKYKSCDGFVNYMPNTKETFLEMLAANADEPRYPFELAISTWILYEFEKEFDPEKYQQEYLDDVWEYASSNGMEIDDEDEESEEN